MSALGNIMEDLVTTKYRFEWTISDFTSKATDAAEIGSPPFYAGANELAKWCVVIQLNDGKKENDGYVTLALRLKSSYNPVQHASFKFSIIKANKDKHDKLFRRKQIFRFIASDGWGEEKFIKKATLINKSKGFVTDDDKLTIVCKITIFASNVNRNNGIQLSNYLQQMLTTKKFSDVTIVVGDKEYPAHKAILAARSPVFAVMFEPKIIEYDENIIKIDDMKPEVLEEVLKFIYTDNVQKFNSMTMTMDLLVAADKYKLVRLKLMCEEVLCESVINTNNVIEILMLAEKYSMVNLKKLAIDFISSHAKEIMEKEEFKLLAKDCPDLLVENFQALAIKKLPTLTKLKF